MYRTLGVLAAVLLSSGHVFAQDTAKRPLDHEVYDSWRRIGGQQMSDDGAWVLYVLEPQDGDSELHVKSADLSETYQVPRGEQPRFSGDGRFVVFVIKPELAAVREAKLEDEDEPKDSLGILDLDSGAITRVERVKSFRVPEEAGGWLAYLLEKAEEEPDTTESEEERPEEPEPAPEPEPQPEEPQAEEEEEERKKKDVGTTLVLRDLETGAERRFESVMRYAFAKNGERLAYAVSSEDGSTDGVYVVELGDGGETALATGEGEYKTLAFDEESRQLAFLSNRDDYEADQPAYTLYHWRAGSDEAHALAGEGTAGIPEGWWVSEHGDLSFSDNGRRLFFGTAPRPEPEPEEEIPEWEKVELDIWNWRDPLLQPQQLVERARELERTYLAVAHLDRASVVQLASRAVPNVEVGSKGDADVAVGTSNLPYRQLISWDAPSYYDIYVVDVRTGERRKLLEGLQGRRADLSPEAEYLTWWDGHERAWFALSVGGGEPVNLTATVPYPVHDEEDDHPMIPGPYGNAGWTEGDRWFLVYDEHDVWATDPRGRRAPRNLTEGIGRERNLQFRYLRLDPDQGAIPEDEPMLLRAFDNETKASGFYRDRFEGDGEPTELLIAEQRFGFPTKAEDAGVLMLTRQSFTEYPDLWLSDLSFSDMRRLSEANPQQAEYLWGSAELVHWRSTDGKELEGILYKPENFDPTRKYPMMVYFYERMADALHSYRSPGPGGSSISIGFYVSRGYVVFVPDVHYRVGYPGESAFDCVVSGVLSVLDEGFVDPQRIGIQGHSWGGYQIAYIVTQSNLFAAAEAGAPVSNMTSAYGGIRWSSGRSRMMQYERTQSRLGGSLWEARPRYIENSPLFWADKVETPVLMLHNDEDGAVPWYQGIEFFVALRRLNKPVWLLNYNGEPHGLRKYQNRKDWAVRMQQFFDHYLKDAPAPVWLAEGVPAVEKGRTLGLEFVGEAAAAVVAEEGGGERH
ncbi:MAG: S9 family peptidase [Gemmatimonadota bacterium]|nr:MAG: S9 family peptidase [Gemmatimonadota bacterium]